MIEGQSESKKLGRKVKSEIYHAELVVREADTFSADRNFVDKAVQLSSLNTPQNPPYTVSSFQGR